ncbi:GNAT family N-acetyltransferase [Candidatus Gracilibacteria bacterium]|nr:GNAT family N-acetyltransferase [Candidatus Gracilibacteria bacterium]NJM87708.1 GNAT family N-acetyltransferase [Hydrococcus sp. RU_2_2]NJP19415.1 GNAT family N-acetyltransferase [Hydrococcus sp. CRU_1_1]
MVKVHLRNVTLDNFRECISLEVDKFQQEFVASNVQSLAEAKVNPNLFPLAIYDAAVAGYEKPQLPMVGFTMYDITDGVGFIMRLMVARQYQQQGYGKAAMLEVIRRLKLYPEVELIATSHRRGNEVASKLYRSLGFVDWDIAWAKEQETEIFLKLDS